MAECPVCKQEMNKAASCAKTAFVREGQTVYGVRWEGPGRCGDCAVLPGGYHHIGCDQERCPFCHSQMLMCGCAAQEDPEKVRIVNNVIVTEALPCFAWRKDDAHSIGR